MASSTRRRKVRMRDRRALLIWKRASFWRARFLAWGEFAIASDLSLRVFDTVLGRGRTREPRVRYRGDLAKAGLTRMSDAADKAKRHGRKAPGRGFHKRAPCVTCRGTAARAFRGRPTCPRTGPRSRKARGTAAARTAGPRSGVSHRRG